MEDANRVHGDEPVGGYWLDACEDISCDFIDFDVSTIVSDQPDNTSNQDFFGGIDRILDSIKNGGGLPLDADAEQPNPNVTSVAPAAAGNDGASPAAALAGCNGLAGEKHGRTGDAFEHCGARSNGSHELSNGNEGGVLVIYSQESRGRDVNADGEERCGKRARLGSYKNERPSHGRLNYQAKERERERERERCFNNNNNVNNGSRKRPRDRDEIDRRDRDGVRKREHCGRRDVNVRDREQRGYWERDRSGCNGMVFRLGTWEADRTREEKMANDAKQESNGKLDKKSEEAKERVPEEKARQYQLDVLEQAKRKNTIAFLETGAGKTLIAVLLIKSIQESLQKQNKKMLAVFLVPKVPLVYQVM